MLAARLQRSRCFKQFFFGKAISRDNVRYFRHAFCQSSRFVERDHRYPAGLLQRSRSLDQDTVLCRHSASDHNSHGCSESQRTRAAYDEHCDTARQSRSRSFACRQPDDSNYNRQNKYCRHENTRHLIRHSCYGGLRGSRIGNCLDYLRKRSLFSDRSRAALHESRCIDGRSRHLIAGKFVDRYGFSRESRLIHRARAFDNNTVHGDLIPRSDFENVPLHDLFYIHSHADAVSYHDGSLWRELDKCLESIRGASFGYRFKEFANCDEGDYHGGRFEVEIVHHHVRIAASCHPD